MNESIGSVYIRELSSNLIVCRQEMLSAIEYTNSQQSSLESSILAMCIEEHRSFFKEKEVRYIEY